MKRMKIEPHEDNSKVVGPVTDLSIYKDVVIPPEVEEAKNKLYADYLEPYKLEIPAYAMKWIYKAAMVDGAQRVEGLEKARQKVEQRYLSAWAKREIKVHDDDAPPMPDDVKQQLKELNKQRREEAKAEREQ